MMQECGICDPTKFHWWSASYNSHIENRKMKVFLWTILTGAHVQSALDAEHMRKTHTNVASNDIFSKGATKTHTLYISIYLLCSALSMFCCLVSCSTIFCILFNSSSFSLIILSVSSSFPPGAPVTLSFKLVFVLRNLLFKTYSCIGCIEFYCYIIHWNIKWRKEHCTKLLVVVIKIWSWEYDNLNSTDRFL